MVNPHNGVLPSNKKKHTIYAYNNMKRLGQTKMYNIVSLNVYKILETQSDLVTGCQVLWGQGGWEGH